MIILIIIVMMLSLFSGALLSFSIKMRHGMIDFIIFIISNFMIILSAIIIIKINNNFIDAIEVYKGNTELKVNGYMKDSTFIPTDTLVIKIKTI